MEAARIRIHIMERLGMNPNCQDIRIQISAKKSANLVGGNQVLKNPLGGLQEGVGWQQQQKVLQRLAYIIRIDPKSLN